MGVMLGRMGLFLAGAVSMAVLTILMGAALTTLMARVNGAVAKVLSEAVRDVFWPKQAPPQPSVDPEESNLYTSGLWSEQEAEPPWETENMEPVSMPSGVQGT